MTMPGVGGGGGKSQDNLELERQHSLALGSVYISPLGFFPRLDLDSLTFLEAPCSSRGHLSDSALPRAPTHLQTVTSCPGPCVSKRSKFTTESAV